MPEESPLRLEKLAVPGGAIVRLAGEIDSGFSGDRMVDGLSGVVVFDLDGVRRITSFGVREWLGALKTLAAEAYCFVNARPALVSQLNMVVGFAGHGALVSLYLPYVCDACDTEAEVLVDLRAEEEQLPGGTPPPHRCESCGEQAEFDDLPEAYLSFVASQRPLQLSRQMSLFVDRALGKTSPEAPTPLSVQKEVHGKVTGLWLQGSINKRARFKRLLDGLEGVVVAVLGGLTEVAPEGAHRIGEILHIPDADVYLARLPARLSSTLDDATRADARGRVVTALVQASCGRCGAISVEVDAGTLEAHLAGESLRCATCGADALRTELPDGVKVVASLMASAFPIEVEQYLDAHPGSALPGVSTSEMAAVSTTGKRVDTQSLLSKYEVVRLIGRGGMAEIFLATQRGPQGFVKRVALKKILPEFTRHAQFSGMLLQEARIAAAITHPNVVQIFDLGRDDDSYFIAMEHVKGWDLRTVLTAARRLDQQLPVELACRIASDICAGLHAAHTCADESGVPLGIVHRDVSPHNVLVSNAGSVKLTDFGVSKVANSFFQTRSGQLKGKVVYMAPEQINGQLGTVDPRSDVFATGLLLYEMLVGEPLFRRDSEYSSMHAVLNARIPKVREGRSDCPRSVEQLLETALARDMDKRFMTARDFQLGLETALIGLRRPATSAHLAQWLDGLVEKALEGGELSAPLLTPTNGTADGDATGTVDAGMRAQARSMETFLAGPDTELK